MASNVEIESKFELDEEGFKRLRAAGSVGRRMNQVNVYFDSNTELAAREATFRVRFGSDEVIATLKIPVSRDGERRTAREVEVALTGEAAGRVLPRQQRLDVARDLPDELSREILDLGIESLEQVGVLRNRRYVVELEEGRLELDHLSLPNGATVFEAEIDSPDLEAHRRLGAVVRRLVPGARPSSVSKFQRLRAAAGPSPDAARPR